MIVLIDTGVAGRIFSPTRSAEYGTWLLGLINRGRRLMFPEVCDYELRRELLRTDALSVSRLDDLEEGFLEYLPIDTSAMHHAAALWADLRNRGLQTADDAALDADCILAGQAFSVAAETNQRVVIATTNVRHLARMAEAMLWSEIS